jgi:hypothetical protein
MREHEASNQFVSTLEAELMDGATCFFGGQCNDDASEHVEDESRVDFNHDAILGTGNDVVQGEDMFDEVEEDLNLPTLGYLSLEPREWQHVNN